MSLPSGFAAVADAMAAASTTPFVEEIDVEEVQQLEVSSSSASARLSYYVNNRYKVMFV